MSKLRLKKILQSFNMPLSQFSSFPDDKQIITAKIELLNESIIRAMKELKTAADIAQDFKDKS